MKNAVKLEHYYSPWELEKAIAVWVEHYNHERYQVPRVSGQREASRRLNYRQGLRQPGENYPIGSGQDIGSASSNQPSADR